MSRWRVAGLSVLALALVATLVVRGRIPSVEPDPTQVPPPPAPIEREGVPDSLRAILEAGHEIAACLVVGRLEGGAPQGPVVSVGHGAWCAIRSPIVLLSAPQEEMLRAELLAIRRGDGPRPDCAFMPDIAYRVTSSADSARILVCHGCGEVMMLSSGTRWICMLGAQREPLLELTHQLFPRDQRILDMRSGKVRM